MNNLRSLPLFVLAGAVLCSTAALAQQTAPAVRIVSAIDESNLVTLKANTLPVANAKNDRGKVSDSLPMSGLILVLSRSPEQQAAFDAFVASQYDSSSPNYHQWLTPTQVGRQFGPAQADIAKIASWLSGHGFTVKGIGADGMTIQFSGTAGQVDSALHTEIHNLSVNSKAHIANMSDPEIPAAMSPVVAGIKGLHNFFPHPMHRMGSKVEFNADAHGWVKAQTSAQTSTGSGFTAGAIWPQANSASAPKPNFSSGTTISESRKTLRLMTSPKSTICRRRGPTPPAATVPARPSPSSAPATYAWARPALPVTPPTTSPTSRVGLACPPARPL